jgi:ATP-dependent RNA helicase RhlE
MTDGGFQEFRFNKQVLTAIHEAGYITPTPVQKKVIPRAMAGQDLIGIAPTGTGKTAAYLLPVIMKLLYPQGIAPRTLILLPTRELAIQVGKEAARFAGHTGLRSCAVYGGTGMKNQLEMINKGVDILVATPGRFMDIYRTGNLTTKLLNTLVIDEADRMMDMGFMRQLRSILEVIPSKKRQNLLFSATFPQKVEELSSEFLEYPAKIEIAPQATTADTIVQHAYRVPNFKTKINLLEFLLSNNPADFDRVIVFTKTRQAANNIFKFIKRKIDPGAVVIHANKDQNARINAVGSFSEGKARVLVTTDVTARGIDITRVSHVINFNVPVNYEDYVHRIGRTGRANHPGNSITFVSPPDEYHMEEVQKLTRKKVVWMDLPPEIEIAQTGFEEKQEQAREIDGIKRKLDPEFKGAFHDKKIRR